MLLPWTIWTRTARKGWIWTYEKRRFYQSGKRPEYKRGGLCLAGFSVRPDRRISNLSLRQLGTEKAWLQLNPFVATEGIDAAPFEQYCADWGIRSCESVEEFNALLEGFGEEAYENASLRTEEESEVMQL